MTFVLIQHLDPTHSSMMVGLLAGHTTMQVLEAADGMPVERDHVYVIPPGFYLSIREGALRLTNPRERHGARMPFDFFLRSLAEDCGARAVCTVLSGTGADGSVGLRAIRDKGGLVIVQDPNDAAHDGMPRSAILTGAADLVLPVAEVPAALVKHRHKSVNQARLEPERATSAPSDGTPLAEIIDLLRAHTARDFALYKEGTVLRQIERRMAMASIKDLGLYLDTIRHEPHEIDRLAKDMLINVTQFFRDEKTFEILAETIIPELITPAAAGHADSHLGRGMQHGRGDLLDRHALPGGDLINEAQGKAAGLRLRYRRRRTGDCPQWPISGVDPEGRLGGAPRSFLCEGRSQLSGDARVARNGGIHDARSIGRCAVLAPRLGILPQCADLPAS
jgi:hypothetical protein